MLNQSPLFLNKTDEAKINKEEGEERGQDENSGRTLLSMASLLLMKQKVLGIYRMERRGYQVPI